MPILQNVPTPIVFDHLAHIPQPDGVNHPLFGQVLALIDKGKTWVKLSGAYADTKVGPPTYADATAVAQAYAKHAPERCVWGSDWPHPGVRDPEPKPDDAVLFDLLLVWAPDEKRAAPHPGREPGGALRFSEDCLTNSDEQVVRASDLASIDSHQSHFVAVRAKGMEDHIESPVIKECRLRGRSDNTIT